VAAQSDAQEDCQMTTTDRTRQEILDLSRATTLYEWTAQKTMNPLVIDRAQGIYLWDVDGKRYMDFNSQLMCVNIGHGDQRVIDAITAQLQRVAYVAPTAATTAVRAELGDVLRRITPGNLTKSFFTNGGAEANENAIKIARWYTGRHKIMARYRSYHGATAGAISLTGEPRRWAAEPGIPGVVRIPDFYPYRAGKALDDPEYTAGVLAATEEIIQLEGPHTIAAIMIESVVGTNGILIPSAAYMRGIRALCDRYGILMIADEVMSGFGRTGRWFAVDHWGVVPDMMSVAKGLTSAYVPLGALIVSEPIAAHFEERPLFAGLTYNAHAVGCAAALATIRVYEEDGLIEQAARLGEVLRVEMARIKERHPSVGDARSIGLFAVFELVKDRATREPLTPFNLKPSELGPMPAFNAFLRQHGVFTLVRWNTFFVNPPLCITEEQLLEGLAVMDRALDIVDQAIA
jgi:taurine--2-oxoglutarate transaminase